ncbi:MAG: FAD-binding protein [Firmicutes bacterium]|nr:FAD-binding protein [Bacillota bacterium]
MYDVAVVGAGPAGATLARLVGKDYRVLVIDRRPFAGDYADSPAKTKCCGGLLAPDAQQMLAELGMGVPKDILVGPQLFTVRTIDLQSRLERYYQRFYLNLDRERFDRWLVSLIPDRVDFLPEATFKGYSLDGGRCNLRFSQGGKEYSESVKVLIGADGANSRVRRLVFPDSAMPKKYIAIQEWFQIEQAMPYFTTIFDSEVTDFYSWTIPKEGCLLVGSALSLSKDAAERFETLKGKLGTLGIRLGKCVKREGAPILRPQRLGDIRVGRGSIALLGEAAGMISPSSAEGLSYAFKSSLHCAQSLLDGPEGFLERYDRAINPMRVNILLKNLKSPFMYNPRLRKAAMWSGLLSMEVYKAGV